MARMMMLTQPISSLFAFSYHSFQSIPKISSSKIYNFQLSSSQKLSCSSSLTEPKMAKERKLPIFLFDIMDTIVRDPFYEDIPSFFGLSMKELLEIKHPTAWIEFEKGIITEEELAKFFFRDGRNFDFDGLKQCMRNGYAYLDGIECILHQLKSNGYEIHAFTNYPCWYMMIEEKLKLSTYLSWTFSSCDTGKRKPEIEAYLEVGKQLGVPPSSCIFVDDRLVNVDAARKIGMVGIHFENAISLSKALSLFGVEMSSP